MLSPGAGRGGISCLGESPDSRHVDEEEDEAGRGFTTKPKPQPAPRNILEEKRNFTGAYPPSGWQRGREKPSALHQDGEIEADPCSQAPRSHPRWWKELSGEAGVVISNLSWDFGPRKGPTEREQRHRGSQNPAAASLSCPANGNEGENRPIPRAMAWGLSAAAARRGLRSRQAERPAKRPVTLTASLAGSPNEEELRRWLRHRHKAFFCWCSESLKGCEDQLGPNPASSVTGGGAAPPESISVPGNPRAHPRHPSASSSAIPELFGLGKARW